MPHLAVLQCQLEHGRPAANQTNSDAVQNHSFAALDRNRCQMVRLHFGKKPPKALRYCDFRVWLLQNCMEQSKEENIHIYIRIGDTFINYSVFPKQHTFFFYFCNFLFYKRRTKTWALHYTLNCSLMQTSVSTHWSHCSLVDKIICYLPHGARAASSAMQYKKTAKQYFSPYPQCGDHGLSQVFPPP